ncbi:flagellar biosynthesis regulator FlaF [Halodurantibacterium flavum]|uniref:Flagellar biosynthesis regulator FlaF n=1 Tax=Halodurantibacterium flavum TaxID=1382802 RepID=A0ABW4S8D1_9RHOB
MYAQHLAKTAYSGRETPTRTLRGIEYDVLARVTQALRGSGTGAITDFSATAAALHENGRLWRLFLVAVADPQNGLPAQLRASLFYLAEFTAIHTERVLAGRATPEALVDINTAVMRGLRQERSAQ